MEHFSLVGLPIQVHYNPADVISKFTPELALNPSSFWSFQGKGVSNILIQGGGGYKKNFKNV